MPRILLVDDEDVLRDAMQEVLELFGYSVMSSASGVEAQQMFSTDPFYFDLVLTDYRMPEIDGACLLLLLRAMRVDIPVVLTSGEKTAADAAAMGFSGFIPKPAKLKQIEAVIKAALE